MEKQELIDDLAHALTLLLVSNDGRQVSTTEVATRLVERLTVELGVSLVSMRQVGWIDHDTHSLQDMETEDDIRMSGWFPVYELGKTQVGVPPLDLDDDSGWGDTEED